MEVMGIGMTPAADKARLRADQVPVRFIAGGMSATVRINLAAPAYGSTRVTRSLAFSPERTQPHARMVAIREFNARHFKSSTKLYSCFFATSQQSIRCFKPFNGRYRHICPTGQVFLGPTQQSTSCFNLLD